jgi:beta propeller repeat protein
MCALALVLISGGLVCAEEFAISAESLSEDELAINSVSTSYGGVETVPLSAVAALVSSDLSPDEFAIENAFTIESVQTDRNIGVYNGRETQITYSATNVYPKISDRWILWEEWVNGRSQIGTYSLDSGSLSGFPASNYPRASPDTTGEYIVYQQAGSASSSSTSTNIYAYDSINRSEKAVASYAANQHNPAISGRYVVWQDWRTGVSNIYLSDLKSGSVMALSPNRAEQLSPAISGTYVVWEDWRNGNADIYLYDITTGAERQLTKGSANEQKPRISGNIVVWQDDRGGSSIYALTLDNMVEVQISFNEGMQVNPDISGGLVVWEERVNSVGTIYLLDLMESRVYKITDSMHDCKNPSIYGTNIVWEDYRSGTPNIYMFRVDGSHHPSTPSYRFYGTVYLGTSEAPAGTTVEAVIDGVVRGSFTVVAAGLIGNTQGPYLEVPIFDQDYGKTIQFYVNQYLADQTIPVATPGISQIRLNAINSGTPPVGTYTLQGTLYIDGQLAPQGTILTAYVGSGERATTIVYGNGQYSSFIVPVYAQDMGTPLSFSAVYGQRISQSTTQISIGERVDLPYDIFCIEPSIPAVHTPVFSGTVLIDSTPAPVGSVVTALVGDVVRAHTKIGSAGQYNNLAVPVTENDIGKRVTFYITYSTRSYQAKQYVTVGDSGTGGDQVVMMSLSTEENGVVVALEQATVSENEFSAESLTLTDPSLSVQTPSYVRLDLTVSTGSSGGTGGTVANSYLFYGFARLDSTMLPPGTVISAYVNNEPRGTATIQTLGQYTNLRVPITQADYGRTIHFTAAYEGQNHPASQQITIGSGGSLSPGTSQSGPIIGLSVDTESKYFSLSGQNSGTSFSLDPTSMYTKIDLTFTRAQQQVGTYRFSGSATINGVSSPIGTQITAKVGNDVRTQVTLQTAGNYNTIDVPIYSSDAGKTISFYATYGSTTYEATQFTTINQGKNAAQQLDLNFITLASSTYRFYGTARVDGAIIPTHTTIYATVDNEVRGSFTVTEAGQYGSASGMKLDAVVYQSDVGKYISFKTASGAEATQTQYISGGLTARKDLTFRTVPLQAADFEGTPISGIAPLTVSFTDRSSSTPQEWYWEFGDGAVSTEKNPAHTYMETGQYTVRLTTSYPHNVPTRQETKYNYITVQRVPEAEASITLSPGWNFISTPKVLAESLNTAEKLFAALPVAGHSVFSFDPTVNQWTPLTANSVFRPFEPVWIYSEYAAAVQLHFAPDAMQIPPMRQLTKGWNTIGITTVSQIPAHNALLSIKDDWVYVIGYNAATQKYEQTIMNVPESYNSLLVPGKGYWIYMSAEGELAGTGA